jgi:hypothetical protein
MIHHRDGIRPRPIDDRKPYFVIKDLSEAKLTSNKEGQAELCNIEKELYKVLDYYDKIRKKQIPKTKIINDKNDKNENKINYNINNNIIYINENNENSTQNNNAYILNYKLSEYKRPDNYIIYSSSEKNKNTSIKKIYEAKEEDKLFLKIRNNFMKIEELEDIIIDLENYTTNEKDDKINEENAKTIIEQQYPKYKKYSDSIINHFKVRRNSIKKSLIRKKWHINKSTDKYLNNTFRKREREKIKTRKNNQNKEESLNKIIEAESFCKNYLLPLINDMTNKEISNRHLLKLEEIIFLSECDKIKKVQIPQNRIQENAIIKENIENIEKNMKLINKKNDLNENRINKELRNKINTNNNPLTNGINNKNINGNIVNNNSNNNVLDKVDEGNNIINENKNPNSIGGEENVNGNIMNGVKKNNERKTVYNKNSTKNKNNEIFPILSLNSLLNSNNISLNEDDINNYIKDKNNNLRVRIRVNRSNKITIDRYIQNDNDFNPFHDSYNDVINEYKKYDNDNCNYLDNKNFDNLFYSYNLNKTKNLNILYDNEDDINDINNDIKYFSNSYKQFLKLKKAHSTIN